MSEKKNSKNLIIFSGLTLTIIVTIAIVAIVNFSDSQEENEVDSSNNENIQIQNRQPEIEDSMILPEVGSDLTEDNSFEDTQSNYQDGEFTASGTYRSPDGIDEIDVSIVLQNGRVKSVSVNTNPKSTTGARYQQLFSEGISGEVEGQFIDEVEVSRVNGSSLTGAGFNEAIASIRDQATN